MHLQPKTNLPHSGAIHRHKSLKPYLWPAIFLSLLALLVQPVVSSAAPVTERAKPADIGFSIIEQQSHPAHFFTQGLLVDGPWLYESSGGYGRSLLARYQARDTQQLTSKKLPKAIFAEGLALHQNSFYLLTWKKGQLYRFDKDWQLQNIENYSGEGWGLTSDGEHLIISDGSDRLHFYSAEPFEKIKTINVHSGDKKWKNINELEYVQGLIWANVWYSDEILAIDPQTGAVLGVADFSKVAKSFRRGPGGREKVLNGLAWSEQHQAMWVTGKYWPRRYLVEFEPFAKPVINAQTQSTETH